MKCLESLPRGNVICCVPYREAAVVDRRWLLNRAQTVVVEIKGERVIERRLV